jgi:hypothetical protein
MAAPPPSAVFWVGYIAAFASAAWLGIGNLFLHIAMVRRGADIPFLLSGLPFLGYFRHSPPVRSRGLDILASSLFVAVASALAGILLLAAS